MDNNKPLVRYFYNGEWKDATVKDIGDLEKLTTSVKTDIVSAINSLSNGTGMTEEVKKAVEELQNNVGNLESSIEDIKVGGLNPAQKAELEKEFAKKAEEVNAKIDEINAETNSKIETIKIQYNTKIEEIEKELAGAKSTIVETQTNLEGVKKDLSNTDLNVLNVTKTVDEVRGEVSQKVDKTDFDLTEAEVERQKTAIEQNAKGIELSATKEELSLANDRVSKAEADIKIQSDLISSKVTHEEVREEIDKIDKYQPNLLRNTRDWIDWINPDSTKVKVKSDTYRMCHILEISGNDLGLSQTVEDLEIGKTYTVTVWAKSNTGSELWMDNGKLSQMAQFDGDKTLSETWKRYKVNVVADKETMNVKFVFKKLTGVGSLSGSKMELGVNASGWQPHADDIYERTIKNETQIQQNSESIISTVETVEAQGEDIKQNKTRIDQQDNSIKLQVEAIEKVGEETKKNSSSIDVMEKEISSKVSSTEVGEMIADVNIDNRNRILNSDFARSTEKWTVSKDFKLKEIDGMQMLHASRTGLKEDMSITATSNSFPLSQGQRVMFGFDFMSDKDKSPDKDVVAILEILDSKDVRVDFKEVSISGKYPISGVIQRINETYITKRSDAAKARLVFVLRRNGSVYFGKGMAQLGDIKSTDWSLAPEDTEIRRVQMETEIKQTQEQIKLTVSKADMDELTEKVNTNTSKIDMTDKKIDLRVTETKQYADEKSKAAENASKTYSDAQLKIETDKISQTVTSVKQTADQAKKDATDKAKETREWAQSQINQTSKEITSKVESVNSKVDSISIGGTNMYQFSNISDHFTTSTFDKDTNTYKVTAKAKSGTSFGAGFRYRADKKPIPYGETFIVSFEIKVPRNANWSVDVNNYPLSGTAWAGNDNDQSDKRTTSTKSLTPNVWTKCYFTYKNTHVNNKDKIDLYDDSNFGIVMTEQASDMVFEVRNIKAELGTIPTSWSPAPEDIDKKIDGIEVGGRNFYKSELTNILNMTPQHIQGYLRNTPTTPNGFEVTGAKDNGAGAGTLRLEKVITGNGLWTVSFEMRGSQGFELSMFVDICDKGSTRFTTAKDNSWNKYSLTVEISNYSDNVFNFVDFSSFRWAYYFIRNIKVEKGNKSTDWTPAPEDQSKEVADLKSWTQTEIKQTSNSWGVQIEDVKLNSEALKSGKVLYTDPLFQTGMNSLLVYNNAANGNVTASIVDRASNPTDTDKVLEVVTKGVAAPNHGGVNWNLQTRANAKFVYKLMAKIPKGRNIDFARNSAGDGAKGRWLTSVAGTDKWEEYTYLLECGASGSFSSAGHFYLTGGSIPTASSLLKWEICYATVIDITTFDNTLYDLKRDVEFKVTPKEIYGMVASSEEYQEEMGKLTTDKDLEEATKGIAKMEEDLKSVGQRVGKFEQTSDDFTVSLGKLNGRVDENNKKLMDVDHFMTFERDGENPDEAYMKIGAESDSMEVKIGRGKISFTDGGEEIAYFSQQQLYISKGVMTDMFQIGSHIFENKGNGSTVLTFMSE